MHTYTQWKKQIQKIRQPTAYCQACLGQKVQHNDFMLTCSICQASIHKTHYASQIIGKTTNQNHLIPNIQEWKCQRCRYLLEKKFQPQIKCEFCPSTRGIMKKVIFQPVLNHRKQIWVHPQCTTWCHPLIYMKSKKRTHYFKQVPNGPTTKFWFRVEDEPSRKCAFCNDSYGYKIKCSFYSCQKFYHITCAKRIGVVRDLQSMRFQVNSDDFCPIYCQQHLEAYVLDFGNRVKLYTQKKQNQKVVHFTKVHNCYKVQLKNLTNAAKRSKQQQEIRNQLGKQLLIQSYEQSSMSLSISDRHENNQMNSLSSQSDSNSSTFLAYLQNGYKLSDLDRLIKKNDASEDKRIMMIKKESPAKKMEKKKKQIKQQHKQDEYYEQEIVLEQIIKMQRVFVQINNNNDNNIQQEKSLNDDNDDNERVQMEQQQQINIQIELDTKNQNKQQQQQEQIVNREEDSNNNNNNINYHQQQQHKQQMMIAQQQQQQQQLINTHSNDQNKQQQSAIRVTNNQHQMIDQQQQQCEQQPKLQEKIENNALQVQIKQKHKQQEQEKQQLFEEQNNHKMQQQQILIEHNINQHNNSINTIINPQYYQQTNHHHTHQQQQLNQVNYHKQHQIKNNNQQQPQHIQQSQSKQSNQQQQHPEQPYFQQW